MEQIVFGSSSQLLRLDFPTEWDIPSITGITLAIYDIDGNELMAADDATLYTATELDGDVAQYLEQITLDAAAGDLHAGELILIKGVVGNEHKVVRGYDSTSKIVQLESDLEYAHEDTDAVYGTWATYDLDISDTDTFYKGIVLRLIWTPNVGNPITELVQVSPSALNIPRLKGDFADRYPRAYRAFTRPEDKFSRMVTIAKEELSLDFMAAQPPIDINRVIEQGLMRPVLMAKMAYIWAACGDVDMADERDTYAGEVEKGIMQIKLLPIWKDNNMDGVQDEAETSSADPIYTKGW